MLKNNRHLRTVARLEPREGKFFLSSLVYWRTTAYATHEIPPLVLRLLLWFQFNKKFTEFQNVTCAQGLTPEASNKDKVRVTSHMAHSSADDTI